MANGFYRRKNRNSIWLLLLLCIIGLELGGYLGLYLSGIEQLHWAGIALEVGTESPWVIVTPLHEASILLKTRFNLGSLLGLFLGLAVYSYWRRR
ncbi:MAG: hypothetical protein FWE76_02030 [Symbiobacteriaceae bacterium]|nr:hypothetical protein [Symbiobacteriaceae bacterium]